MAVLAAGLLLAAAAGAQTWEAATPFPAAPAGREDAAGVVHQGALFALGGTPFDANLDSPAQELAADGSAWLERPVLEGTIVHHGAGVDAFGRLVVFGGRALVGDDEGQAYVWDPVEGKQGAVADRGGAAPVELFAWATDADGRIYSLGGGRGATATPGNPNSTYAERYDAAADAWHAIAPMAAGVADAAAVYDGRGHLLVIGGFAASGGARTANVARYDVASDTWSDVALPDAPVALSGARAVLGADDRVYLLGGSNGTPQRTTWVLDLDAASWSAGPDMLTAREGFAAALLDDFVYAMGGTGTGGGTALVERLYTPPCPVFAGPPAGDEVWTGQTLRLTAEVAGGTPLGYQWRKDGLALSDGPSAGGGTISGAATPSLAITAAGAADGGSYDVVCSNPCGSTTSAPLGVTVLVPPALGSTWVSSNLHPPGALLSRADAVSDGEIVGSAAYPDATYGSLDHPVLWPGIDAAAVDLTPAGSVGGGVVAVADGVQAGWFWWPYTTPQGTGYNRHACLWHGSAASHVDVQPTSFEFGSLADTDGTQHVGTMRWDESSTNTDGGLWNAPVKSALVLTPGDAWGSSTNALHAGRQYGQVHLGFGVVHAAMWSGSAASFVDMNPPGSSWSYITGAGRGQQVGRATFAGVHRPVLWGGAPDDVIDLLPPGATSAELVAVDDGLQVGHAQIGGVVGAAIWAGSAGSFVSLHDSLDGTYGSSHATGVDVDAHGTITVTGYGYRTTTGRTEALVWRFNGRPLSADVTVLSATTGGTQTLLLFAGPQFAGHRYFVLGSASGTEPGLQLNPWVHLPLQFDVYTQFLLDNPNNGLMPASFGTLDDQGTATIAFALPAGLPLPFELTLHHAYVLIDPANVKVMASNAEALVLQP